MFHPRLFRIGYHRIYKTKLNKATYPTRISSLVFISLNIRNINKRKTSKNFFEVSLAGPQGFEPWMTESESVALPLGDGPMLSQQMVLYIG